MNSPEKPEVPPEPVLQLKGVAHQYGTGAAAVHALSGLDLTVNTGEVVLVVGPSGGGKTTALLVMGLLLTPASGLVRIRGRDVGELAGRTRTHQAGETGISVPGIQPVERVDECGECGPAVALRRGE